MNNRIHNCTNPYQGKYKRVLCVCSAGLLRSPTAAFVLSQEPYNYNTRAVGINEDYALIPLDKVHVEWADEIVVMNQYMADELDYTGKPIKVLDIPDNFGYRDERLMQLIREKYDGAT